MPPRGYARDTTVEALASLLAANRTRFLVGRDELSGWLRVRPYNRRVAATRKLVRASQSGTLSVDRKTGNRKPSSCTGRGQPLRGIQPGMLRQALSPKHFSAGIPARVPVRVPAPGSRKSGAKTTIPDEVERRYDRLVRGLVELEPHTDDAGDPYPVALGLAPDAKAEWVRFYQRFANRQAATDGDMAAAFYEVGRVRGPARAGPPCVPIGTRGRGRS